MTFPASDLRFGDGSVALLAISADLYATLEQSIQWARDCGVQLQELTGIGLRDCRRRAGLAKTRRPFLTRGLEQAAFFHIATAEIIAVKIFTFLAGRGSHRMGG